MLVAAVSDYRSSISHKFNSYAASVFWGGRLPPYTYLLNLPTFDYTWGGGDEIIMAMDTG